METNTLDSIIMHSLLLLFYEAVSTQYVELQVILEIQSM